MSDVLFGNNNKAVIKKVANRNFHSNKKRNILAVIAIALTTFLLTAVLTIGFGAKNTLQYSEARLLGSQADALVQGMTKEQAEQLKEHSIRRRYRAIVAGVLKEDEGTIEGPIGRHPIDRKKMAVNYKNGKDAVTHYKVLERFKNATYVECRLETGRTHQIRVHMTSIGHPLLGDEVYGSGKNPYHLQGQTLHAMILGFVHPSTGEYMEFTAPLPEYFVKLLEKLRK